MRDSEAMPPRAACLRVLALSPLLPSGRLQTGTISFSLDHCGIFLTQLLH